jgi:hypothetical protein
MRDRRYSAALRTQLYGIVRVSIRNYAQLASYGVCYGLSGGLIGRSVQGMDSATSGVWWGIRRPTGS